MIEKLGPKLDRLGEMLEQKYGVEDQSQINWQTGEILPAQETADQSREEGAAAVVDAGDTAARDGTEE